MTVAQTAMYFAEWGKLRDVLRARGWNNARIETHRHEITRRVIGWQKSSKHFTNADLDKVLAAIKAELAPADFNAQMRMQDQPDKRVSLLVRRIGVLSRHIGIAHDKALAYVDGIARRMYGLPYAELQERDLQQLEGVLRRRIRQRNLTVEQIEAIERDAADAGSAEEAPAPAATPKNNENPF